MRLSIAPRATIDMVDLAELLQFAVAQRRAGNWDPAERALRQALTLAPRDAGIRRELAWLLVARGNPQAGLDELRRALADEPAAAMHNELGRMLQQAGQLDEAAASFQEAIRLDPGLWQAEFNLGNAHRQRGQLEPAAACYRRALEGAPNDPDMHESLGLVHKSLGETGQARAGFAEALRLGGREALRIKRTLTLPVILESAQQVDVVRRQLADELAALARENLRFSDPAKEVGAGALAFGLAYQGHNDRETQAQIAAIFRRGSPALAFVAPHCAALRRRRSGRRIRVGFVSAHLHAHTIGKLNAGLIERLNREAFEVFVFRCPREPDELATRIAASADVCVTLSSRLAEAQSQIAEREVDVLYYTDIGMEAATYFLAHTRLAPVQCVTWGHPLTTGIPTLDYFVSSEDLEPPGSEGQYTEKLVRLAHLATYYFRPEASTSSKTRQDFGLADNVRVYACLQSLFKLHPDDDEVFAEILRRDPAARLLLLEGNHSNWTELVRKRFHRSIPDVCDRIQFVAQQPPADFSRLLAVVDVLLDPLHFGGGDTSYQSFAVGAPVVTLPSGFLRGRITYALYRAMGIDELTANDPADYVERALRLAGEGDWRDMIQSKILAAGDKIFENPDGVRDLEAFLTDVVHR